MLTHDRPSVPIKDIRFPDGEIERLVKIILNDSLALFSKKACDVPAQEFHPEKERITELRVSLEDFAPDAVSPDGHYYRIALYTSLYTQDCQLEIPLPKWKGNSANCLIYNCKKP